MLTIKASIATLLAPEVMAIRGAFHPDPDDNVPDFLDGSPVRTLVLLGWTGGRQWPAFAGSPEAHDGQRHPLDRWSRRLIDTAAAILDAAAFYPFGGPPHHNFQRWAMRAEVVERSPIGLLVHPRWGLWHAYRGALGFRDRLALPMPIDAGFPCKACADKPCLSACPVAAFSDRGFDIDACARYLNSAEGAVCLANGCAARLACPVVPDEPYSPAQNAFHMQAFLCSASVSSVSLGKIPPD